MKELQEYTAEVFRRSQQKIRQRKQNRRRLALCLTPIVLSLGIFTAALQPWSATKSGNSEQADGGVKENTDRAPSSMQAMGGLQENPGNMQENPGNMQENPGNVQENPGNMQENPGNMQPTGSQSGSLFCTYVQVEICSDTHHAQVTDRAQVASLYATVMDLTEKPSQSAPGAGRGEDLGNFTNQAPGSAEVRYTFAFQTAEGDRTVYTLLSDNTFTKQSSGQSILLNDDQLQQLQEAFGLPG